LKVAAILPEGNGDFPFPSQGTERRIHDDNMRTVHIIKEFCAQSQFLLPETAKGPLSLGYLVGNILWDLVFLD